MQSRRRVLIVDDDPVIQRVLRVCLEDSGFEIEQATDGAQALEAVEDHAPDVLLLDLAMPVLDGMSVLADLHSMLSERPIRVIVMTAHGSARAAVQAIRLGAADFIEKPFKPEELRKSIATVLDDAPPDGTHPSSASDTALRSVRDALRRGKFYAAEAALQKLSAINDREPCYFNLAGVLQESHGRHAQARSFYEKALAIEANYQPAHHNLKRLNQIEQQGSTRLEVALGDEPIPIPPNADAASAAERIDRLLREIG